MGAGTTARVRGSSVPAVCCLLLRRRRRGESGHATEGGGDETRLPCSERVSLQHSMRPTHIRRAMITHLRLSGWGHALMAHTARQPVAVKYDQGSPGPAVRAPSSLRLRLLPGGPGWRCPTSGPTGPAHVPGAPASGVDQLARSPSSPCRAAQRSPCRGADR